MEQSAALLRLKIYLDEHFNQGVTSLCSRQRGHVPICTFNRLIVVHKNNLHLLTLCKN